MNSFANSPLVSQILFKTNGTTRMTTTKQYDYLNRLASISSAPSASSAVNFGYAYNDANQRTRRTETDSSYWVYQYDSLGQVTSGKKYWNDGTPVPGQQFEYAFDDMGNRTSTKAGGDAAGSGFRSAAYSANTLNQYTSRDVPNAFDVLGASHATNSVTVNGSAADYRREEYFQELLTVVNASTSVWQTVSVANSGGGSASGSVFVAKTPETFGYDKDGNMTNDGRWTLTWDAENRLAKAESLSSGPTASKRRVVWEYDGKSRRTRQTTYDGSSGSYVVTEDLKFISDGWRHIAELNASNDALVRSYAWGLDLSGSLDGAGGVGGLLMLNSVANGVHFYAMDGNGNTAALVKASDGSISANYEYDPFGQTIRTTGTMASENRFCFSTKRTDRTTDFVLYEYRIYVPSTGRWPNRDPINENGFNLLIHSQNPYNLDEEKNLYGFVRNNPVVFYDADGRAVPIIIGGGIAITTAQAVAATFGLSLTACMASPPCAQAVRDALEALWDKVKNFCRPRPKTCLPCIPPVGSVAYRVDMPPSPPHNGIPTPHSHMYQMHQSPPSAGCVCFWVKVGSDPLPGVHGPAITPAGGGGIAP